MRVRILVPASFFVAAVFLWTVVGGFKGGIARYELIGPAFFPKILLLGIIALTAAEIVRVFISGRGGGVEVETGVRFYPLDLALAVAITVAYVAALHLLGFLPATYVFQAVLLAVIFRERRWHMILGIPLVLTSLFFVIFIALMGVPLPRGTGVFLEFSKLLY